VLLAAAAVPLLFPRSPLPRFAHLEEGVVAGEDVIAEIGFPVGKSEERLREQRAEAERSVAPIFEMRAAVGDSSVRGVERFFASLDSAARTAGDTSAVREVLSRYGTTVGPRQVRLLTDAGRRRELREAVQRAQSDLLPDGIAPMSDISGVASGRVVVRRGDGRDLRVARDSLTTLGDFYEAAMERAPTSLSSSELQLYQTLLIRFSEPTLRLDEAATEAARRQARQAVETTAGHVLEGERIVAAHERVGSAEMEKLNSYREALRERGMVGGEGVWLRSAGSGLYALLLLGLLGTVLLLFRPEIYADLRDFGVVVGLVVTVVVAARLLGGLENAAPLVPVAFAALLIGGLYDGLLALVATGVMAALLAGQPPFGGATAPLLAAAGGAAASLGVKGVHRRADSWILIAVIAGAYTVTAAALGMARTLPIGEVLTLSGLGAANAAVCTLFAMGAVLPALERFTGITTEQTLLELCDLNRPLLRQLSREAPGTYAHSINVANLAEAACDAIGADAVLARAGVYYHDVGKMARPQFFIENQPRGRNPHDRIPPAKSAEVIKAHVTEGLRMARDARLPEDVKQFIREHHGTTRISYFLEKAREAGGEPDPEEYRYPGPRPRSRETAVVMLADGVESAARTLVDPDEEGIRELVQSMISARVEDGQLDESPLTLRDLDEIEDEFVRILAHIYHKRIEYPEAPGGPEEEPPKREERLEEVPVGDGSTGDLREWPVAGPTSRIAQG
jgi:putative nucleotidyltransferase with HDIG domain